MRVALVHDMLLQYGGAEKVLKALTEIFPEAPVFTLLYDEEKFKDIFPAHQVKTSFLQKIPGIKIKYKWYLPLMPQAIESFDFEDFDLVISSSSGLAKGIITSPHTFHICYCHTPARYLWGGRGRYLDTLPYPGFIKGIGRLFLTKLRMWDSLSNGRVDKFIANSFHIQKKIKKYYQRSSQVVYPPVEVEKFSLVSQKENYFLTGGRLVPYKRFDIAIQAFNKLKMPLKVFGSGPEEKRLKKMAASHIEFLGFVSEEEKAKLFSRARAFIHPQEEDFGISVVEALAAGTPVIAYRRGGAQESLKEGKTGLFFQRQTWEDLAQRIIDFYFQEHKKFIPSILRQEAEKFSREKFKEEIKKIARGY